MQCDVEKLCTDFAMAVIEGDYGRAAMWTAPPVTITSIAGTRIINSHGEAAEDIRALWEPYKQQQISFFRHRILGQRTYSPGLVMADVEWTTVNDAGDEVSHIYSTYTFRNIDGLHKVVQIVSHNELLERPLGMVG